MESKSELVHRRKFKMRQQAIHEITEVSIIDRESSMVLVNILPMQFTMQICSLFCSINSIFDSTCHSQWNQIFPDAMMTVAVIDRINHHATIVEIDCLSYRMKNQLNHDVINKPNRPT
ncbi:ATP-binding protein [Nitrosomonas supralitoralis]|uniref:IstB-like ATP-binding domain-containing protein n=1 Tax=Nitrosomonas supralitoralis TaxID=2116706 RepID=A0A2P7NRJ6_9PROT|nr:hypothetical protein C7H79_15415 [Nitrosomonas supralitoralis]